MEIINPSPIDDIQPCGYVRTILCFPDVSSTASLAHQLRNGIAAIVARWPFLRGVVNVRPGLKARGRFIICVQPHDGVEVNLVDHTSSDSIPAYTALAAQRFPISELNERVLCSVPEPAVPGKCIIVQANFLKGGLLLSICLHHCIVDGEGARVIIQQFAQGCRSDSSTRIRPDNLDRSAFFRASDRILAEHPTYKSWNDITDSRLKPMLPTTEDTSSDKKSLTLHTTDSSPERLKFTHKRRDSTLSVGNKLDFKTYFCSLFSCFSPRLAVDSTWTHRITSPMTNVLVTFSDRRLKALKFEIIELLSTLQGIDWDDQPSRISTNDCLSALLWQAISAARASDATMNRSKFIMAVDARTKITPSIGPTYTGAVVVHGVAEHDVRHVRDATTLEKLGLLAMSVRDSISAIDDEFIADTVAFANAFPDLRKFGLKKTPHNDILMTSWEKFAYQDMHFGEDLGYPQWARKPWSASVADVVVLPKSASSDDIEVVLLLSEDQIERLKADTGFMKYVRQTST